MVSELNATSPTKMVQNVEIFGLNNRFRTVRNVPILKVGNKEMVNIDDIIKAEQVAIAEESSLTPKQLPILTLLYADNLEAKISPNVRITGEGQKVASGIIKEVIRFHKMLFEVWQRTIARGYGEIYPHHEFYGDKYGPVSKDLKPEMYKLEKMGLVEVKWAHGTGETSVFKLTNKGMDEARKIWEQTPEEIKREIISAKDFLSLATSKEIVEYYHEKYPEYKKIEEAPTS